VFAYANIGHLKVKLSVYWNAVSCLSFIVYFPHTTECHCSSFNWYSRRNAILFMPHIQIRAKHFKNDIRGSQCGILVPPSGPNDVY